VAVIGCTLEAVDKMFFISESHLALDEGRRGEVEL
jgi:hypothetical protein